MVILEVLNVFLFSIGKNGTILYSKLTRLYTFPRSVQKMNNDK